MFQTKQGTRIEETSQRDGAGTTQKLVEEMITLEDGEQEISQNSELIHLECEAKRVNQQGRETSHAGGGAEQMEGHVGETMSHGGKAEQGKMSHGGGTQQVRQRGKEMNQQGGYMSHGGRAEQVNQQGGHMSQRGGAEKESQQGGPTTQGGGTGKVNGEMITHGGAEKEKSQERNVTSHGGRDQESSNHNSQGDEAEDVTLGGEVKLRRGLAGRKRQTSTGTRQGETKCYI